MNIGNLIYSIFDLFFIGMTAYVFFCIHYEKGMFPKDKAEKLYQKFPIIANKKLTMAGALFMSLFFIFRIFEKTLPAIGIY